MDNIRVLFLNLSNNNDSFSQEREELLQNMSTNSRSNMTVQIENSIENAKKNLANTDVFIMWVEAENSKNWQDLDTFMEEEERQYYLGFIVIFGFEGEELLEKAREALLRRVYTFVCPINFSIFEAFIEALASEMRYKKSLADLKIDLLQADSLDFIVNKTLQQLKEHPLIGYDRATISLVDRNSENHKRYLLKLDPSNVHPDRSLQKDIKGDKLIMKVDKQTVLIIENLPESRQTNSGQELIDIGWDDKVTTQDINSWIGLAAKHQNKTIAIITLDHKTAGKYKKSSQTLIEFLKDFSEIFADAIENFFLKRNEIILKEIINGMGNDLKSKYLVNQILQKLKNGMKCDNCTCFLVSHSDKKEIFLSEWTSSEDAPDATTKEKIDQKFKKGVGIVGTVLETGKSRIVPHACEDERFLPTLNYPGHNLSILAVPIILISDSTSNQPNRIIGVICCDKKTPDYFTVYDRDLVENITLSVANVIERTIILEYSNEISSKMADLVVNCDEAKLLKEICCYTLKVSNAGSASIYLLQQLDQKNYRYAGSYYTYPAAEESPPRLTVGSSTDQAILKNENLEFSNENGNFNFISEQKRQKGVKCTFVVLLRITNKDGKQKIVGVLYLDKYAEEQFSQVEKFSLELFASQAASIIYDRKILDENTFRANAHKDFAQAIEVIASTENTDLLLQDIAKYSYSLVKENLHYPVNINSQTDLVSYLVIGNTNEKFEIKAAWPLYELNNIQKKCGNSEKKGITGLVIRKRETIIINDIDKEKQDNTENGKEYIEFKDSTKSQLSVPIKDNNSDRVIGVINLEHSVKYAFDELHQEVIEYFARQVAIAFQKKTFMDQESTNNKILRNLHESLGAIVRESPQTMLYRAVSQTREALESQKVIVIPYKQRKNDPIILQDKIVPVTDESLIKILTTTSLTVYRTQQDMQQDMIYPDEDLELNGKDDNQKKLHEPGVLHGLCLPFSSGCNKIGVMWILFPKFIDVGQINKNKHIYKVYANQIALAYSNSQQFQELKKKNEEDLSKEIKIDYRNARWEATVSFAISLVTSIVGLGFIFVGVIHLLNNDSQNMIRGGGIATSIGVLLQAITVLAFDRGKAANDRLDQYHQELYNVGKLSILLSATEQLEPEVVQEEKQKIIQTTTNNWLKSTIN